MRCRYGQSSLVNCRAREASRFLTAGSGVLLFRQTSEIASGTWNSLNETQFTAAGQFLKESLTIRDVRTAQGSNAK